MLTTLFGDRGVHLDRTMQLNVGGNSDFRNMLERERLESKKISKTNAVTSMLDYDIGADNVHVGPSDYVPWLTDRKWAYIRMEGSSFGDVPLNVELKLEVWDSPNSAGIVIDAVRLAKLALNNGIAGSLEAPSAYLMKSPPKQIRRLTRSKLQLVTWLHGRSHDQGTVERAIQGRGPVRVIDAQGNEFVCHPVTRRAVLLRALGHEAVHRQVAPARRLRGRRPVVARRRLGAASGDGQCGEDEYLRRTHPTARARRLLLTPSRPASASSPRS